jgi:hypothetical protein
LILQAKMHMVGAFIPARRKAGFMEEPNTIRPVDIDAAFDFMCSPHVACFNACCRDLNQFLTPYDVLRLARHLEISTGEFLRAYTTSHDGPETGLPVVGLKPAAGDEKKCPFVTDQGCRVYENRPGSCRMYPLARMLRRSRQTAQLAESYVLICEPHCRGFDQGHPVTVRQWIRDQGLVPYNQGNDAMIGVIAVKQQHFPGPVKGELGEKLFMSLYDLDAFRHALCGSVGADCRRIGIPPEAIDGQDDDQVLAFALQYAGQILCHAQGHSAGADSDSGGEMPWT